MPRFPWVSSLSESINFCPRKWSARLHDGQGSEASGQSALRLTLKWGCVRLYRHNKATVFWATRIAGWALAGCTTGIWIVLYGNLAKKDSPNEFRLAVIFPCICLILQNCDLAKLASVKHFVVLAWLRNEH